MSAGVLLVAGGLLMLAFFSWLDMRRIRRRVEWGRRLDERERERAAERSLSRPALSGRGVLEVLPGGQQQRNGEAPDPSPRAERQERTTGGMSSPVGRTGSGSWVGPA